MIPRVIVPADARISDTDSAPQTLSSIEKAHLVPRRLIPANARLRTPPPAGPAVDGDEPRHADGREAFGACGRANWEYCAVVSASWTAGGPASPAFRRGTR